MLVRTVEPDFELENESGRLVQLVREGWKQVNVVSSFGGSVRGGHHHDRNEELFYVVAGSFLLTVACDGCVENREFARGDMFVVPKGVDHWFFYHEDTVLVGMYDQGVELGQGSMDIIPADETARNEAMLRGGQVGEG